MRKFDMLFMISPRVTSRMLDFDLKEIKCNLHACAFSGGLVKKVHVFMLFHSTYSIVFLLEAKKHVPRITGTVSNKVSSSFKISVIEFMYMFLRSYLYCILQSVSSSNRHLTSSHIMFKLVCHANSHIHKRCRLCLNVSDDRT